MGLSLKKEEMVQFLESAKSQDERFKHMLWGTVIAKLPSIQNRSAASQVMLFFSHVPGVAGTPDNAFCYIGITEKSLYVIALDTYDTSKIIGTFILPFVEITSLAVWKAMFGASHTVEIECGEHGHISLTVKNTSIGTDIKDQKERVEAFLAEIGALKTSISVTD